MYSLADREKLALLQIAREALVGAVKYGQRPVAELASSEPQKPGVAGAFVTLRCRAELRGCIGQIGTGLPLEVIVAHCAVAAAMEDLRFRPLRREELADTELEISILSEAEEIAPDAVVAGKHGLIVSRGNRRGLLLPQVAEEHGLTPQRFLEETCVKAGLPREAWKDGETHIAAFTAEVFSENKISRAPEGAPRH